MKNKTIPKVGLMDASISHKKQDWVTLQALVGSVIITPHEIKLLKKVNGIDIIKIQQDLRSRLNVFTKNKK